jgi:hypothetical protein
MKMSLFSPVKVKTYQQIQAMRIEIGLPPIKMAFLNCFNFHGIFLVKMLRIKDHAIIAIVIQRDVQNEKHKH